MVDASARHFTVSFTCIFPVTDSRILKDAQLLDNLSLFCVQDAEFEKCEHVTDLPLLTCFLLSALGRTKGIKRYVATREGAGVRTGPNQIL